MSGAAQLHVEVVSPLEVEAMYPRRTCSIGICIFTTVTAQIVVLFEELPESNTVSISGKLDFRIVARNIHQVVCQSVAIEVVAVGVAPARG